MKAIDTPHLGVAITSFQRTGGSSSSSVEWPRGTHGEPSPIAGCLHQQAMTGIQVGDTLPLRRVRVGVVPPTWTDTHGLIVIDGERSWKP